MMITTTRKLPLFAALACGCLALPALAQGQIDDLKNQTEDLSNLIDAENAKSALCKSYVGKRIVTTSFTALALTLPKSTTKGEFETTKQYQARVASSAQSNPAKLAVLTLPVDRSFVRYNADIGVMLVAAGALTTGHYSDQTGAEMSALFAERHLVGGGTPVFVEQREKVVRTYVAQNAFGAAFRVSEIERTTHALHLTNTHLFPFAKRETSPIMGFEIPLASARRSKETIRVALVLRPQAPFLLGHTMKGIDPTTRVPIRYTDRSSVMVAEAQCALVLNEQNQVLASIDTGKLK